VSAVRVAGLVVAGVLAGTVGTAGGITSLISYPALVWAGLTPLPAAIANIVAVVACWPGSALTSRQELRGTSRWLLAASSVGLAGGVAGAALLLATPARTFGRVAAPLLLLAAIALVAQPRLTEWQLRRGRRVGRVALAVGLFLLSLYNGYFGAGSGIMLLLLMLLAVEDDLARANALKNMLVGAACLVSAVAFVLFAHVVWSFVAPLAGGLFVGSLLGPVVVRRLPTTLLRSAAALTGLALSIDLFIHPT
jgi:uncharacterized membrane protein YfcA